MATIILGLAGEAIYDSWLSRQLESRLGATFNQSSAPIVLDFVERPTAVMGRVRKAIANNTRQCELSLEITGLANPVSSRKSPTRLAKRSMLLL